jgi:membrane protein DedA with SNARE-associated domain
MGFAVWLATFAIEHLEGLLPAGIFATITTVPAALWGLGFAILGYALGQLGTPSRRVL